MNKKIQELARQAGGIDMTNNIAGVTTWIGTGSSEFLEKFAELIVREAAQVANENVGAFTPSCGNFVMDHFGVKR